MATDLARNLSEWLGLPLSDVSYLIATAPVRYKVFSIPKRRAGMREIAQPSRELKKLQRLLIDNVLTEMPRHEAAHGFVLDRGIRTNALAHINSNYILKMDLRDFFPSIRPADFRSHMRRYLPHKLSEEELVEAVNIIFWKPKRQRTARLCIGAPSSPAVSNSIMYDIDAALADISRRDGVVYTRYADDMTFSCTEKNVLQEYEQAVAQVIREADYPRLSINQGKTVHISRAQRRMVTGVILSSTKEMSLGRNRKRLLRAMAHRYKLGDLDLKQKQQFLGMLAFANDIEPSFAAMIRRRAQLA